MNQTSTLVIPVDDEIHLQTEAGQVVVSSRYIAERFGKGHNHVIRDIENLINEVSVQNWTDLFTESQYQHPQNKQVYKEYLMNRDGFTLLAMGFTGKKAIHWKFKFMKAFNKMEQQLKQSNNTFFEALSTEMKALIMQDKKIQSIEHKVIDLEDNIHITRSQQQQIKKFVAEVVVKQLGGKQTQAYKELKAKAFSDFWKAYQNALNVPSYLDTPKKDFKLALNFINNWTPGRDLQLMIKGANTITEE